MKKRERRMDVILAERGDPRPEGGMAGDHGATRGGARRANGKIENRPRPLQPATAGSGWTEADMHHRAKVACAGTGVSASAASVAASGAIALACGDTLVPGIAPCMPAITTLSPGLSPVRMMRSPLTVAPSVTGFAVTLLSGPTTSTVLRA